MKRTRLAVLSMFAVVAVFLLSACDKTNSPDLLAPHARDAYVYVGPPRTCTPWDQTTFCQLNFNIGVSAGEQVTCSLRLNGAAFCWGSNANDMLGNGWSSTLNSSTPVAVLGGRFYSSISVGFTHVCAIERNTGAAFCWGRNDSGQLGDGYAEPIAGTPVPVAGGVSFSSIAAGAGATCGVSGGREYCWGAGYGNTPGIVGDPTAVYTSVSVGNESPGWLSYKQCALISTSALSCVSSTGVLQIAQGGTADHFCFIDSSGFTRCWGNNYYGQVGNSTSGYANNSPWVVQSPAIVSGNNGFQSVATGGQNTCALSSGSAFCWGKNDYGQLGAGTSQVYTWAPQAVSMPSGTTFTQIAVGDGHACAIDNAGWIWCWGRDDAGQAASTSNPSQPVKIVQPTIL